MIDYNTLTITQATLIQKEMKEQVIVAPFKNEIKLIGGADISFNKFSTTVYAGIVLLKFPELIPVGYSLVKKEVNFPYVPGFLAFREVPALLDAWEQLPVKPDVLVVDGHGIAHPRKMRIATHFGVLVNHPTIGSAKKKLYGKYEEPGLQQNEYTTLSDRADQPIGTVLRSKNKVKPIFVSPGHLTDVPTSLEIIQQSIRSYRLPEPTRMAHNAVNSFRKGILAKGYTAVD